MTSGREVDYGTIEDDFAFFIAHSSESEAQIAALGPHLAWLAGRPRPARMLDFGCGDGDFTESLLRAAGPPPESLVLWLLEPVAAHLAQAAERLARLADRVTPIGAALTDAARPFDLILANHSLYYVRDLRAATADLLDRLAPGGRLIAALLDRRNALAKICRAGFASAELAFPYFLAEDFEAELRRHGVEPMREPVAYRIAFADSREARLKILRFLLAHHFQHLPPEKGAALFDPFEAGGRIVIETAYPHLIAERPAAAS